MTGPDALDFDWVHHAYRDKVLILATKLVGPDDAEDVCQEVFVKIHRSLGTLSDRGKLAACVYTITLNAVRDAARRRSARPADRAPGSPPGPTDEGDDPALSRIPDCVTRAPEEWAMRNEMIACYLDFVGRLPPRYHEVYVLSEFEHLDAREIASRLGVPTGTVKMRLHRARVRLIEELRLHCQPYRNERGELMGEPRDG